MSKGGAQREQVVPNAARRLQRAVASVVYWVEWTVTRSLRCTWRDDSGLLENRHTRPVIFCLWHNRLAISMLVHRRFRRKLTALVSASRDGALLTAVLSKFGVEHVRGSTSRRGPQALLELTRQAKRGYDLAVTPDGPKGPRYVVQTGVVALAQVTGLPIIAVTCNTRWKWCTRSWDRFQIPLPLSRCELILSRPVHVPQSAGESDRERYRAELEQKLREHSLD